MKYAALLLRKFHGINLDGLVRYDRFGSLFSFGRLNRLDYWVD